jgi:hypothetical protein
MLNNQKKSLVVLTLVIFCGLISYYLQSIGYGTVYSHLFYIPIILSCIWWQKRGIVVATLLGIIILLLHFMLRSETPIFDDLFRSIIFIIIALLVSKISLLEKNKGDLLKQEIEEVKDKSKKLSELNIELGNSQKSLLAKTAELEKWYELTIDRELKMVDLKKQIDEKNLSP